MATAGAGFGAGVVVAAGDDALQGFELPLPYTSVGMMTFGSQAHNAVPLATAVA